MQQIDELCFNRRLDLTKMFLGTNTAKLIARLLMREEIDLTHLKMPYNNLGDDGMAALSHAISANKTLVYVDLRQNSITPRCARSIYIMLAKNSYELNFSHNKKSYQFKNIRNLKDIKEQINSCAIYITFDTTTFIYLIFTCVNHV